MKEKTIDDIADAVLERLAERERISIIAHEVVHVLQERGLVLPFEAVRSQQAKPQGGEEDGQAKQAEAGEATGQKPKRRRGEE